MTKKGKKPSYIVRPSTAVLTRGFDPKLSVGSARPAVFRSSTYVFSSPEAAEQAFKAALGESGGNDPKEMELIYSRLSHPNAEILEDQIVPLEPKAEGAAVFNSGLAAISTVFFTFVRPGRSLLYTKPLYGGTHHLIHQLFEPWGVKGVAVPAEDTEALKNAISGTPDLDLVFVETPANPTLRMTDIGAVVSAARNHSQQPIVAVDNTFMGPAFQHPLRLGADLAVYSATKFLSGFSDMLGGVVMGANPDYVAQLRGTRAVLGNILQPDECWMLDSRLPTVIQRMNRQSKNAQRIAERLAEHEKVEKMYYPSLFEDPEQKRIRDAQCSFPGSLFSMYLKGGKKSAFDFLRHLRIFKNAVSLGAMESLACHPATTTHSEMDAEGQKEAEVTDSLVRISVGTEDWRDLYEDIRQALDAA